MNFKDCIVIVLDQNEYDLFKDAKSMAEVHYLVIDTDPAPGVDQYLNAYRSLVITNIGDRETDRVKSFRKALYDKGRSLVTINMPKTFQIPLF